MCCGGELSVLYVCVRVADMECKACCVCLCVCVCVCGPLEHTQFEHVARAEEQLQRHICHARYISGLSLRDTEARYRSGLCHFS